MQRTNFSLAAVAGVVATTRWLELMRESHARGEHEGHVYVTCPGCAAANRATIAEQQARV